MPDPAKAQPTGPAFLTQCACFECRKTYKKDLTDPRYRPICPECSGPLRNMGRYFRAPRKADTQQWRKVEMLAQAGVHFRTHEFGRMPETLLEAREFLERNGEALAMSALDGERGRLRQISEVERAESKRVEAKRAWKRSKAKTP